MLQFAKRVWKRTTQREHFRTYSFDRPLVLLQSDDWGRVGVRDREGYERLRDDGMDLGENPYDFYTLETAGDIGALRELLDCHRDSTGRGACMVMNFLSANLDFPRMALERFEKIYMRPLQQGLPGKWNRPGLFEAYRDGIAAGSFYPALHGLMHFCPVAVTKALANNEERARTLHTLWQAETPYIYWRMPWVGYEYSNPEFPNAGFLSEKAQDELIGQASGFFQEFFSARPQSACAPGYRANEDTRRVWSKHGIRVAQNGPSPDGFPSMNELGMLSLYRTLNFEPSQTAVSVENCLQLAHASLARGMPLIISVHSINFHSSLKDFRSGTLAQLDQFLSALERKYPDLLYVHDADVYELVDRGAFTSSEGRTTVTVKEREATQ
jgi:hypothetical protein